MNIKLTKDIVAVGVVVGFEPLVATDAFSKNRNSSARGKDSEMFKHWHCSAIGHGASLSGILGGNSLMQPNCFLHLIQIFASLAIWISAIR